MSGCLRLRRMGNLGVIAKGNGVSSWGDEMF